MRAPSKRVTFLFAFLAANFLLWFPFASSLDDTPPDPEPVVVPEGEEAAPGEEKAEEPEGEQE